MSEGRRAQELEAELARVRRDLAALRQVVDAIPHRVFWKDRNCVWLGANHNLALDCNAPDVSSLIGKTDHDFFPKEHADFFQECDRAVMESGEALLDIEEPQKRPDGSLAYLLTSKVPLRDASGEVVGVVGMYVDITDRKLLEREREEALVAARAAAEAKSNFLAVVSHELRTPLALITGPLETMVRDADRTGADRGGLELVLRNALRLKDLVDDVLDFSKIEAGKLSAKLSSCDVSALISSIVEETRVAAEARAVSLEAAVQSMLPLDCDPLLFNKIALNLVGNAIKFTPPGGTITVTLESVAGGDQYELRVSDTGPGIPADQLGRLFQRFEQVDNSVTRAVGGTGLGLALVKEFAALLEGDVGVETEVGRGSTFWVRLPARREGVGAGAEAESSLPRTNKLVVEPIREDVEHAGQGALRVVVAEDNADMRAHIRVVLGESCALTLCPNGASALEAIEAERPQVVVSDVMMPVMDGFELTRNIRRNPMLRSTPVILLTARAGAEAATEGLDAGADDYVAKPFSGPELVARVRAAARMSDLYRELESSHTNLERAHGALSAAAAELASLEDLAVAGHLAIEARDALGAATSRAAGRAGAAADIGEALSILERVTTSLHDIESRRPS